jgi:arginyl-tRNA synthetase
MKFDMLVIDANKKIVFDMQKALRFDGETWPYLQYTYARCAALLRKGKNLEWSSIDRSLLTSEKAKQLLLHLWDFWSVITKAAESYQPYLVARYLLDLSQLFNSFYQSERVFDEDDRIWTNTRLMLIRAVQQVMGNGLWLLGIETLEEM